jgi:hypothetical protein
VILERPQLERRVVASLDDRRIPVLLGGCGTGRTSLLLRLVPQLGSGRTQYLDVAAAATTPERCLAAVINACPFKLRSGQLPAVPDSPRAAFESLLTVFDDAVGADGGPVTFLLDDFLDVRTFESFPGLRHVQNELVARLGASPNRFALASRFTSRSHRLLRDAPARFEVVHTPPLEVSEVVAFAQRFDGVRPEWARSVGPAITALAGGRAAYVGILLAILAEMGEGADPIAALVSGCSPGGPLAAVLRYCYEFRLHRARGYGALKAILGVLADVEPLNLTEIAQRLQRTPGSARDYLSWLEDVDLIAVQRKRYSFEDPLLRMFVRLNGRPVPPSGEERVREVHTYAQSRLPVGATERGIPAYTSSRDADEDSGNSIRIAEID